MRRMGLGISMVLALSGCSSAAQEAEERFKIISRNEGPAEQCKAAKQVANEYLKANDEYRYQEWKLQSDIICTAYENERWKWSH